MLKSKALGRMINHMNIVDRLSSRVVIFLLISMVFRMVAGAQTSQLPVSKESALQLFSSGSYAEALDQYSKLSEKFPADPLYKYYSGVSIILMGGDPARSSRLLEDAKNNSTSLRPVPADLNYYLGRAYQQGGEFSKAIACFEQVKGNISRREVKEYKIDEFLVQCREGRGSIMVVASTEEDTWEVDKLPDLPVPDMLIEEDSNKLNEPVSVGSTEAIDPTYDRLVEAALKFQFQSDSVNRLADRYRSILNDISGAEKESIVGKILALEKKGFELQSEADNRFKQASALQGPESVEEKPVIVKIPSVSLTEKEVTLKTDSALSVDSVKSTEEIKIKEQVIEKPVPEPVFKIFEENTTGNNDIPINSAMPEGLYYRIQTAAFRNPVKTDYFLSLWPLFGYKAAGSDITFYYIGLFRTKSDADKALVKVRNKGFKDAFVVAAVDGNRISMERAAQIEPKWKTVSLFDAGSSYAPQTVVAQPQEPLTLVYRVELNRVAKPLKQEELDHYKKLAGERIFDIFNSGEGDFVYLIGKFITFESAATYSDLLYRNGIKEARVVAYLGSREIPIEKARELFELYFNK